MSADMNGDRIINGVVVLVVVAIVLVIGMLIVAEAGTVIDTEEIDQTVLLDDAGTFVELQSYGSGSGETVLNSRGNGARFTGANDSYIAPREDIGINVSANWTVSQGVRVNSSSTGDEMIFLSLANGDVLLRYDGPNNQWQGYVYRPPSDTYTINVSASDPTNNTVVALERAGDTLTIYENNSAGDSEDLSQSNTTTVNPDAGNLNGTLDETHVYQSAIGSSGRQALVDDPVHPLSVEPIGRLMYDEFTGDANDIRVYFASGNAEASNVSLVGGFAGETMDEDTLLTSGDYDWDSTGPKIAPVSGARLDGHPVAFVEYDYDRGGGYLNKVAGAFDLAAVLPVALVAALVFGVISRIRSEAL